MLMMKLTPNIMNCVVFVAVPLKKMAYQNEYARFVQSFTMNFAVTRFSDVADLIINTAHTRSFISFVNGNKRAIAH